VNTIVLASIIFSINILIARIVYTKLQLIQTQTDGKLSRLETLNATLQARLDEAFAERSQAVQAAQQEGRREGREGRSP